jgi:membrane fusion protein (multidrug efflux system)
LGAYIGPMGSTSRFIIAGVVAVAALAAAYFLWGRGDGERGGRERGGGPVLVTLGAVETRAFADVIEAVGTAKAKESIDITAKSADTIGKLNFTDGQRVAKGFVIAEMTSREQAADLGAARASLAEAEKAYTRISDLARKGFATRAQLDGAVAARDAAAARVRSLDSRVSDRLMRAPFGGVLGLRRVSMGSLVRPGDVITTLDDISLIKLDFTVPEAFIGSLQMGSRVKVTVAAYPERSFEGKVAGIDTRVDPVSRAVAVRAEIANEDGVLKPGMLMTVNLITNQRKILAVPEEAIVPIESKQYVYLVTPEKKAERREIKIGARQPGFAEVLSGLKDGEKVVVEGTLKLRPDADVKFAEDDAKGEGEKPKRKRERGNGGPRS